MVVLIQYHFNNSTLIHFLVYQFDRKSDEISKRRMNQEYCLSKVGNAFT